MTRSKPSRSAGGANFAKTELSRRKDWTVDNLWDVNTSEWALADESELAHSVEQVITWPRNLDYVFPPLLDLIKRPLDNSKRASGSRP